MVLAVRRVSLSEVRPGIERIVTEEFVESAVEVIRTGLNQDVDIGAGRRSVLSAGVRLDLEFLDSIDGRMNGGCLEERAVVVHSIERIVSVVATVAGNGERFTLDRLSTGAGATHRSWR